MMRVECRYGLAWSPFLEGHLLSGSDDAQICLWDIRAASRGVRTLEALQIYQDHSGVVEVREPIQEPNIVQLIDNLGYGACCICTAQRRGRR